MLRKLAIFIIRAYQTLISPFFPPSCRFYPTCSTYSIQAYQKYNFFKATYLAVWRVLRCNPLNKGGYDPLP